MTDQAQVVQENPEMNKVREVFDRALNAIIEQSKLAETVKDLQASVDALRRDMERLRSQNEWMDEQLTRTRQARDEALASLSDTRAELHSAQDKLHQAEAQAERDKARIASLEADLATVKAERDEYGIKHMEVSETLAAAQATLAKLKEALGISEPPPKAVEDTNPVPMTPLAPDAQPPHPVQAVNDPPHGRVYEGEEGFFWGNTHWDGVRGQYYINV